MLDLKAPKGLDALKRLVAHYDVLVEGFRPGVMERLGLGYEVAKALNPRLIYCSVTGYGATGPDRSKAGHDINYTARAGVVGYGGDARGAPSLLGTFEVADIGGGCSRSSASWRRCTSANARGRGATSTFQ